jgi:ADP-heptose:LPS heptosyltransferase
LIFTSFSQSPHSPGYACYLAGIPLRAGESKEFGGATLSTELRGAPDELHQVERNLRLVEHLGFEARDRRLRVELPFAARQAVPGLLERAGLDAEAPFILFHPGASASARRYPSQQAGEVARLLQANGWPVLLTGTERETDLIAAVRNEAPGTPALIGGTSLPEYAALIDRAALVISGNTLPMHLADALGTPALILFSGTDLEAQWAPRSTRARLLRRPTECHPCYRFECPIGLVCLDIPPEEVVAEAEAMFQAGRHVRAGTETTVEIGR